MNIKIILLVLFSLKSFAGSDPLFLSVSYYDGLGEKFRVETASSWPNCQETKRAQKIFLHVKNELREIALWDRAGKMHGAGRNNNPALHREVNAIFAGAKTSENPCMKPVPKPKPIETPNEAEPTGIPTDASGAILQ